MLTESAVGSDKFNRSKTQTLPCGTPNRLGGLSSWGR